MLALANPVVHLQIARADGTSAIEALEGSYLAVFKLA